MKITNWDIYELNYNTWANLKIKVYMWELNNNTQQPILSFGNIYNVTFQTANNNIKHMSIEKL
jgi:hypothetical protein